MKNLKKEKPSIWVYLKKYKFGIFLYIFLYVVAAAISIFQTIMLANAIEQITLSKFKVATTMLLIIFGMVILKRICWFFTHIIYQKYATRMIADMNLDLSKQAFKLNSRTYTSHDTGTFVQRIVYDPSNVIQNMSGIVDILTDIVSAIVMLIYISTLNGFVALAYFGVFVIGLFIEIIRFKYKKKNLKKVRKADEKINSLTTEIVRSEKDIKSLGLEKRLSVISKENYEESRKIRIKFNCVNTTLWSSRNLVVESFGFLVLILGVFLMDKALLTMASFMIIYSSNDSIWNLIFGLGNILDCFAEIKVGSERMFALFDEDEFITEKFGDINLEIVTGSIEFKDVCYTYKEYEFEEPKEENYRIFKKKPKREKKLVSENPIFKNLSFKIEPHTTVAFVGKSGSGKSTILNLIARMLEVESGSVLIDGVNINDLTKESLRNTISLVNQSPYIFDMTIKENLILAKENATDEEINSAIDKSSLREFINTLPNGIETKVGESGIKLSGGQRQRLAIARAMLRKSPITIFDESTSSLDNFSQGDIKKSIDEMKGSSTIIIVAHRLSTIKNVDKIFFLDEGKIVDSGTFDELFENNEKFKTMFLAENI